MNCQFCKKAQTDFLSQSICASCGVPQAVTSREDFFSVFGLPRHFVLDRSELEKRFYQLSRSLHPDRFTAANIETKTLSLGRMSLVNQAYGTLKNIEATRAYLIKLEKLALASASSLQAVTPSKASIPMELAEAWFELQELILEDPTLAKTKLELFQFELRTFHENLEKKLSTLEVDYDLNPSRPILEKLEQELQTQSYLKSMERDLERLKKNAYSN